MYFAFLIECEMYIAFMAILQLDSRPLRPRPFKISQVGVAMDDERQMSTLHPKQRGEHAGPPLGGRPSGWICFEGVPQFLQQHKQDRLLVINDNNSNA